MAVQFSVEEVIKNASAASGGGLVNGSRRCGLRRGCGGRLLCGRYGALGGSGADEVGGDVAPVGHGSGCNVPECAGGDLYGCGCHNLAFLLLFAV